MDSNMAAPPAYSTNASSLREHALLSAETADVAPPRLTKRASLMLALLLSLGLWAGIWAAVASLASAIRG